MILTEWNTEDAIAFAREEGREDGREDGLLEGRTEGQAENARKIARNLLAEGSTPEFIKKITGLDLETIQKLKD